MNNTQDIRRQLESAFERWTQIGPEHSYINQQSCVPELLEEFREPSIDAIIEQIPEMEKLPDELFLDCFKLVTVGAILAGADVLAALTRPADTFVRCNRQLDKTTILDGFSEILRDKGDIATAFDAAIGQLPLLDPLCQACTNAMARSFSKEHPALAPFETKIAALVHHGIVYGVMLEFVCVRLVHEENDVESGLERMFDKIASGQTDLDFEDLQKIAEMADRDEIDFEDPRVAEFFAHAVPSDALPWPLDRKCACGASLDPFIFCCDAEKPIPPESFQDRLSATFVLKRDCCGATLDGFRCDLCGRLYSWWKGIAMRLGVDDLFE